MEPRTRQAIATVLTSGVGVGLGASALAQQDLAMAGAAAVLVGLGVAGVGRRSLLSHVLARGALGMTILGTALNAVGILPWPRTGAIATDLLLAAGAGAALVVARPLLHTDEAQRAFAPARFRGLFLAGAIAAAGIAFGALVYAFVGIAVASTLMVAFNGALAALLVASIAGLLRMRTWGLVLGAFASLVCLVVLPFYGIVNAWTLGASAAPALLLWVLPVLLARRTSAPAPGDAQVRIGVPEISLHTDDEELDEVEDRPEHVAARA